MGSFSLDSVFFVDLRKTTELTIPYTNKEMFTSFSGKSNDSVMELELKAGARAVVISVNQQLMYSMTTIINSLVIQGIPGAYPGKPQKRGYPNHRDSASNRFVLYKRNTLKIT